MFTRIRFVAIGVFIVTLAALPVFRDATQSMAVDARTGEPGRGHVSVAAQDDFQEFQKGALAFAISKQKQSKFQFTANESMNFWDLRKKLSAPIEKRRRDYRDWLDQNRDLDTTALWNDFVQREDEALYALFRKHLDAGEHCEAVIYAGWISGKEMEKKTYREAYDYYIESYEQALEACKMVEKGMVALKWTCKSYDGKTATEVRLISEGVRPQSASTAANLYADRNRSTVWPSFPTVAFTYRLPDEPVGLWRNFMLYDIRHYDRTASDRMKEGLNWMTSGRGTTDDKILREHGVGAAVAAFADKVIIDATPNSISFTDWETTGFVSLHRTKNGLIYTTMRREFRKRCDPLAATKADTSRVESEP